MVEIFGYNSLRTNQEPLRRTLAYEKMFPGIVHRRDRRRTMCRPTGILCNRHPTLRLLDKVPSPAKPRNSSTECRVAGYSLCIDRRGVDATLIPHLANAWKTLAFKISELIDRVQDGGVRDRRLTDDPSIGVFSVRIEFSDLFKLVSFN